MVTTTTAKYYSPKRNTKLFKTKFPDGATKQFNYFFIDGATLQMSKEHVG